jgi:DNA-directed RNA polymerase specialized sigma subunit
MINETQQLINNHLDLLNNVAGQRHSILRDANITYISKDELINVGYFGLATAAKKFDPISFSS